MTKTNVQPIPSNSQHHDTPNNKTHVIKFRVTAEEKASLELTCKLLNLSLSTFIRRAIHNVKIEKTVIVAGGGEETLTAVSTLLAQCSKVGGNLNQLARHFNSGGADTEQIRAKLLDELADLTAFRLNAEKVLGELYGNAQALESSTVWNIESPAETATISIQQPLRKPFRRNCVKLTQFLPPLRKRASASRLQSGTMSANPTLPVLKNSCAAWRLWSR